DDEYDDEDDDFGNDERLEGPAGVEDEVIRPIVHGDPKVGRNDPCPCGSGKKFKKCCMNRQKNPPKIDW
ncbi:MAG: SEC-C metal-binding domain-containing protein, partial [Deltaproteobacteria bacterium]